MRHTCACMVPGVTWRALIVEPECRTRRYIVRAARWLYAPDPWMALCIEAQGERRRARTHWSAGKLWARQRPTDAAGSGHAPPA